MQAFDKFYTPTNLSDLLAKNKFLVYVKLNSFQVLEDDAKNSLLQIISTHCHNSIEECHLHLHEANVSDIIAFLLSCSRISNLCIAVNERIFHYTNHTDLTKSIEVDEYYLRQIDQINELFAKISGFITLRFVSIKRYHNDADVNNEMLLRIISKNSDSLTNLNISGTDITQAMLVIVFATCKCLVTLQLSHCFKFTNDSYVELSNISNTLHTLFIMHSSHIHTSSILLLMTNFKSLVNLNITSCESVDLSEVRLFRDEYRTDMSLKLIRYEKCFSAFSK
jgi:hypothetical protein